MNDFIRRLIALFVLIIVSPLILMLALIIGCTHKRILFCYPRLGVHKKPFMLYKFTTMHIWSEKRFHFFQVTILKNIILGKMKENLSMIRE